MRCLVCGQMIGQGQFARQFALQAPGGIERGLRIEWFPVGNGAGQIHRGCAGADKINRCPFPFLPSRVAQNPIHGGKQRIHVILMHVLPPPGHGGADRTAERSTPQRLPEPAQIRVGGNVPRMGIHAKLFDHHRLAVIFHKRAGKSCRAFARRGFVIRVVHGKIHFRQRPDFRPLTAAGEAGGDQMTVGIVRVEPSPHLPMPRNDVIAV